MKFFRILALLALLSPASAQTPASFFPPPGEFPEIGAASDKGFDDPDGLVAVENGGLIADVGFDAYARRSWRPPGGGALSLEIIALRDFRAAYSLLTLLRPTQIEAGPPGDAWAGDDRVLMFAQGRRFVRLRGSGVSADLPGRIAASVSSSIGPREDRVPSLVSRLPEPGREEATLEYYPGLAPLLRHSAGRMPDFVRPGFDMEIARARYSLGGVSVTLTLLDFPTPQMAEAYFEEFVPGAPARRARLYGRQAGPLVALLEGDVTAAAAETLLDGVRYSYSVRWLDDERERPAVLWGVPLPLLRTVVNSFLFVMLISVASILVGALAAICLFRRRQHRLKTRRVADDDAVFTRLRLR
jgi:hypothetical protein